MAKIVIAEDEPDIRELIAFTLRFAGFDVIAGSNGQEGYELTKKEHPDLAMFDVRMPKMTGYDACRLIKADPEIGNIPMIAVTAHTLPGDRRKALDAGFDSYISKPINIHMFDITVGKVLEQKQHPNNT